MKKTIFMLALFLVGIANANNDLTSFDAKSYKVEKESFGKVNALCVSIFKGDYTMVKKLIELGADVNEFSGKKSPLMYAARFNRVEIIKLLVANGASLDAKDEKGNLAKDYAKQSKAKEAYKLLDEMEK